LNWIAAGSNYGPSGSVKAGNVAWLSNHEILTEWSVESLWLL